MTGEKIRDPSFPFIASDLVPRLGQLVCGEPGGFHPGLPGQVSTLQSQHDQQRPVSLTEIAENKWAMEKLPSLSLLVQDDLLQLCKWSQVEWFQGWGEYGPFSLKRLSQSTSGVVSLREFYILSTLVAVPSTRALCWIPLWTPSLMLNAHLYAIGILMNMRGIAWKAQFASH